MSCFSVRFRHKMCDFYVWFCVICIFESHLKLNTEVLFLRVSLSFLSVFCLFSACFLSVFILFSVFCLFPVFCFKPVVCVFSLFSVCFQCFQSVFSLFFVIFQLFVSHLKLSSLLFLTLTSVETRESVEQTFRHELRSAVKQETCFCFR